MGCKTESDEQKRIEKWEKKREPPLVAPIRVLSEFNALKQLSNSTTWFRLFSHSSESLKWNVILCPAKEPYNKRAWRVEFELPRNYPQSPPKVKFATPIYHPNVSIESGEIKLKLLEKWRESMTMTEVVYALLDLIYKPNAEDSDLVLNDEAAKHYRSKHSDFKRKVEEYAYENAIGRPTFLEYGGAKKCK